MCIRDRVQGALRMIRYGKKDIVKQLRDKMEAASERLDFETAALLRDQIMACLLYTSLCGAISGNAHPAGPSAYAARG